ncbi:MAG: PAS domain S-box protein, partial [Candidatus Brocadiales bacterium]
MKNKSAKHILHNIEIILAGIGIGIFYWLVDAAVHTLIFNKNSFGAEIFPLNDIDELWMRLTFMCLIIGSSLYAQIATNKRRQSEKALKALTESLERRVAERTEELVNKNEELRVKMTAIKRAEEAVQEREARIHAVLDNVVDGIITIDEHGLVMSFNPAAERIFGYSAAEVIGKNVNMLMPEPSRSQHNQQINNYLRTGKAKVIGTGREAAGRRKDGSTFPVELAVSEMRMSEQRLFTGVVRDITERKRAEEIIKRMAQHDILTKLPNRTLFKDRLTMSL